MKKEKTVKTHTRKTKSGKTVTVKQHTAKYDAAEQAKEIVKKAGAGAELEKVKKAKMQEDPYKDFDFTAEEFAEWYEGTGSKADKKVEKALRKALGRKAYDELNDAAAESYKKGGADRFFTKEVSVAKPMTQETPAPKEPKTKKVKEETPAVKEKTPKSKKKGGSREELLLEYGEMPKYLKQYGGTQEDWASWMEGDSVAGGSYEKMDKVADKVLRVKYGKEWKKAKEYYEEMARLGAAITDNFEPKGGSWGGVKPFEAKTKEPKSKTPKEKGKKESPTPKEPKGKEPKATAPKMETAADLRRRADEMDAAESRKRRKETKKKAAAEFAKTGIDPKELKAFARSKGWPYVEEMGAFETTPPYTRSAPVYSSIATIASRYKKHQQKVEKDKAAAPAKIASLKEKGYKTVKVGDRKYLHKGDTVYDITDGGLRAVHTYGAKPGTWLRGQVQKHKEESKRKRDAEDARKYRESQKAKTARPRKKKKNTPEEDAALDATLAEIRERNKQPYQVSRRV